MTSEAEQIPPQGDRPTLTPSYTVPRRRAIVPVHPTPCGKYTLIAKIGHGGMAEVFLAVATGMAGFRKLTVVKRIHPQLLEEPEFVNMFMDEARLAARLSHPNVVQTYEVGEHDGVPFIAMEYMEGQPYDKLLKQLRREGNQIPLGLAVRIAMEALAGLQYAHDLQDYDGSPLGVVHRDISPSNIFITYQGMVKILDFGVAKAAVRLSETRTGQVKGKLAYMAPEQARGKRIDQRADVWSMGVTLFESCTGTRLFKGESEIDTLQRVLSGDIQNLLRSRADQLPPQLLATVEKALARKVSERYANAQEVRAALAELLPDLEGSDMDLAAYVTEQFADVAQSQRAMVGDLLENASSLASAPPPEITAVAPAEAEEEGRSRPGLRLVLLGALLAAGLVAVALLTIAITRNNENARTTPGPGTASTEETPPTDGTGESPPEDSPTTEAAAGLDQATSSSAGSEAENEAENGDGASEESPEAEEAEPAEQDRDRLTRQQLLERRAAVLRARQAAAARAEEAAESQEARAETGYGTLRLVTRPWSEVFLDGRSLGVTPLMNVRLPAGGHALILRNDEQGIEQRVRVRIRADELTRLNLALE